MNQILSTSVPTGGKKQKKRSSSGPADVKTVVRVFSIILLIFGVFMIGSASYGMYKNYQEKASIHPNPTITVESMDDDTVVFLKVVSEVNIDEITYRWNDEQETTIYGNGRKYVEERINVPTGSNILNISVTDIEGGSNTYSNTYELQSNINIEALDTGKIKITYEGDEQISYMTYRWDEEDETRVDINNTSIDYEIDAKRGEHTLTVIVVDVNNKTETKVQKTKVVSRPTIEVTTNNDQTRYIIKITDETELQEVVVTLNEDENQKFGQKLSGTEFQFEMPINSGSENKMEVVVTNADGVEATSRVSFPKD